MLALLGACVWLFTTRRPAWIIGWMGVFALTLLASTSKGTISQALTLPWYHIPQRINYNQAYFVAFFAAVPFAFAASSVVRLLHSRRWVIPATAIGTVVFLAAVGLPAYSNTRAMLHDAYAVQGVRPASIQAYTWLARHADARDTVINDAETDGSLWMYPYAGLNPLFGFPTPASLSDQPKRAFLRDNIAAVGRDQSVDTAARAFRARWIYLDEHTFPDSPHVLNLEALRSNPNIVEVFDHRTVHIFAITFAVEEVDRVPPTTSIFIPHQSPGPPSISGRTVLRATASDDVRVSKVEVHASGGGLSDTRIGTAKPTYYGWLFTWATTSLPNGTYNLTSVAFDGAGNSGRSADIGVAIQN